MNDPIIRLHNVVFKYDGADRPAVDHVSMHVMPGEFVAVLGRNGSGKSTLARLLNALLIPGSGTVEVDGIVATEDDPYAVR